MSATEWIKKAEKAGWWLESVKGASVHMVCGKQGCPGKMALPLDNLGPIPSPCELPHEGEYSALTFDSYNRLVQELSRRRRSLGLSQEDITAASGLTDGHINKLEALVRVARIPTLQLWAQTLGLALTLTPAPMPPATRRIINERVKKPYSAHMARHKPQQKALFNE